MKKAEEMGREWTPLTVHELIRFLAFVIYRGIFPSRRYSDYFKTDVRMPSHINFFMPSRRIEQIKRFLHISGPEDHIPGDEAYYDKVRPLMEHVQEVSKCYYVPSTNVAVDKMI
ncbi:hypothetical protein BG006_004815, partial [Podila minutissima]